MTDGHAVESLERPVDFPQQITVRIAIGVLRRKIERVDQARHPTEQVLGKACEQRFVQTNRIGADAQGIGHDRQAGPRLFVFGDQAQQQSFLERTREKQVAYFRIVALPVAVDAAVALFQPVRVVRQIQMDQVEAALVQVQALGQRVGADQDDPVFLRAPFGRPRSRTFRIGATDCQNAADLRQRFHRHALTVGIFRIDEDIGVGVAQPDQPDFQHQRREFRVVD